MQALRKQALVESHAPILRPFGTLYYPRHDDPEDKYWFRGAASSEEGAVVAAVRHIIRKEVNKVLIVNRHTGAVLYTVMRHPQGIAIHYGRATGLVRVK